MMLVMVPMPLKLALLKFSTVEMWAFQTYPLRIHMKVSDVKSPFFKMFLNIFDNSCNEIILRFAGVETEKLETE